MQLTYTLTIKDGGFARDIIAPSDQTLRETLKILCDGGVIEAVDYKIRSTRNVIYLDPDRTYEDLRVYSGDILELVRL